MDMKNHENASKALLPEYQNTNDAKIEDIIDQNSTESMILKQGQKKVGLKRDLTTIEEASDQNSNMSSNKFSSIQQIKSARVQSQKDQIVQDEIKRYHSSIVKTSNNKSGVDEPNSPVQLGQISAIPVMQNKREMKKNVQELAEVPEQQNCSVPSELKIQQQFQRLQMSSNQHVIMKVTENEQQNVRNNQYAGYQPSQNMQKYRIYGNKEDHHLTQAFMGQMDESITFQQCLDPLQLFRSSINEHGSIQQASQVELHTQSRSNQNKQFFNRHTVSSKFKSYSTLKPMKLIYF